MSRWEIIYKSKYPCRGELKCKCDKCGNISYGVFRDYRYSNELYYELPKFCDECGDKKENIYDYDV